MYDLRTSSIEEYDRHGHLRPPRTTWLCGIDRHSECPGKVTPEPKYATKLEQKLMCYGALPPCECSCHPVFVEP